jgi:nicotinamidase-related amidase
MEATKSLIPQCTTKAIEGGMYDLWGRMDVSKNRTVIKAINEITSVSRAKGLKIIYTMQEHSPDLSDLGGPNSPNW